MDKHFFFLSDIYSYFEANRDPESEISMDLEDLLSIKIHSSEEGSKSVTILKQKSFDELTILSGSKRTHQRVDYIQVSKSHSAKCWS